MKMLLKLVAYVTAQQLGLVPVEAADVGFDGDAGNLFRTIAGLLWASGTAASHSTLGDVVDGFALFVHQPCTLSITAVDRTSARRTIGGYAITATVQRDGPEMGPVPVVVVVAYAHDGTYAAVFTPMHAGECTVPVVYRGQCRPRRQPFL